MRLSTRRSMSGLWSVNCVLRSTNGFVAYRRSTKAQGSVEGLSNLGNCRMNAERIFLNINMNQYLNSFCKSGLQKDCRKKGLTLA